MSEKILSSDSRYRKHAWAVPELGLSGLTAGELHQRLKSYHDDRNRTDGSTPCRRRLLALQAFVRQIEELGQSQCGFVSYNPQTKTGTIHDLASLLPELLCIEVREATCSLYVIRFDTGTWAGHCYIGITSGAVSTRMEAHFRDAFRVDKDTGAYARHSRLMRAIRETESMLGSGPSAIFRHEVIRSDLSYREAQDLESETIIEMRREYGERLLNERPGGSIGGRHGSKEVLLDGQRMYRSDAIRRFAREIGCADETRLSDCLNYACKDWAEYHRQKPIELRPALKRAVGFMQADQKAYSSDAFRYWYRGRLLCFRQIQNEHGIPRSRLTSLRHLHGFKPGDCIDEYADGKRQATGAYIAGSPMPHFQYLKDRDAEMAQRWLKASRGSSPSWNGLAKLLNRQASSIRYAAKVSPSDIGSFWSRLGVTL
ncbi:hypothetical protein [Marinobacter goseongensis]|uniref:hypothetical protein n=1 Tax=Marinobacter goseongensis TaxID=453838 RepID=UPI0020066FE1|nr:hypothetical protein [Marinobacter goseongensis]MCK7553147.1 hypothetical protein [Marinobacter goseongensis]